MKTRVLLISVTLLVAGCTSSDNADGAAPLEDAFAPSATGADAEDAQPGALPFIDAFTSCAIVEAGFIAALNDDSGAAELYARGATAAMESGSPAYTPLGDDLEAALGSPSVDQAADTLLTQCQIDGFERLAG